MGASDYLGFVHVRDARLISSEEARSKIAVAERTWAEELAMARQRCDELARIERDRLRAWEHHEVPGDDGSNPFIQRGPGWGPTPTVTFLATEVVPFHGVRSFRVGIGRRPASAHPSETELVAVYRATYERSAKTGRARGDRLTWRVEHGDSVPTIVEGWLEAEWLKRVNALGSNEDPRRGGGR